MGGGCQCVASKADFIEQGKAFDNKKNGKRERGMYNLVIFARKYEKQSIKIV